MLHFGCKTLISDICFDPEDIFFLGRRCIFQQWIHSRRAAACSPDLWPTNCHETKKNMLDKNSTTFLGLLRTSAASQKFEDRCQKSIRRTTFLFFCSCVPSLYAVCSGYVTHIFCERTKLLCWITMNLCHVWRKDLFWWGRWVKYQQCTHIRLNVPLWFRQLPFKCRYCCAE